MAANNKINISEISKTHDGYNAFHKNINLAYYGSTGQKYGTIEARINNARPLPFDVNCFILAGQLHDIQSAIEDVQKDLESYENGGKTYKFEFIKSKNHDRFSNCKILTFYVINSSSLSELIWDNQKFKRKVSFMWTSLCIAHARREIIRDPNTGSLFNVNSGRIGFEYQVDIPEKIEFEKEAINFITNEVEKAVKYAGDVVSTNFTIKTTVVLNDTNICILVNIE